MTRPSARPLHRAVIRVAARVRDPPHAPHPAEPEGALPAAGDAAMDRVGGKTRGPLSPTRARHIGHGVTISPYPARARHMKRPPNSGDSALKCKAPPLV
jgi:hypothetical protein